MQSWKTKNYKNTVPLELEKNEINQNLSNNSSLDSLSVEGFELNETFDRDLLEYSVNATVFVTGPSVIVKPVSVNTVLFNILFLILGIPKHTPITRKVPSALEQKGTKAFLKNPGCFFFFSVPEYIVYMVSLLFSSTLKISSQYVWY